MESNTMAFSEELKQSIPLRRSRGNNDDTMLALPMRTVKASTPSNRFVKAASQSLHQRADFLRSELGLCFVFVFVAAVKYEVGKTDSAKGSLANAEEVYASVRPFVSDPKYSKHLPDEVIEELAGGLRRIREKLNSLRKFMT